MATFHGVAVYRSRSVEVSVHDSIYCDSDGHYYMFIGESEPFRWTSLTHRATPEFIYERIRRLLRENIDNVRVYEKNQDGEKRFDNYRYHTMEMFCETIGLSRK